MRFRLFPIVCVYERFIVKNKTLSDFCRSPNPNNWLIQSFLIREFATRAILNVFTNLYLINYSDFSFRKGIYTKRIGMETLFLATNLFLVYRRLFAIGVSSA